MDSLRNFEGWLLDASLFKDGVILWVKTIEDQKIVKIYQDFHPEFFVVPKSSSGNDLRRLQYILEQNSNVKEVRVCEKYVKLEDHEKSKLFGVSVSKPSAFKKTIKQ